MSYTQFPTAATPNDKEQQPKDNKKLIYGLLIAALVLTWGYIIYDKSKSKEIITKKDNQIANLDSSRNAIQVEYNDALSRLDSVTGSNIQLQGALAEKKNEIDRVKQQITTLINQKDGDLAKARQLIRELNGKIDNLFAEVQRLKGENKQLAQEKQQLGEEKDQVTAEKNKIADDLSKTEAEKKRLAEKVDVASTFHVSNIAITPKDIRGSGKEKTTTTAKRVDLLRISFEIDENRVAPSGTKDIYVSITSPDGKIMYIPAYGSGNFTTRNEGEKLYTNKVTINYEQGKKTPVSFDWKQDNRFQTGDYKIEIYHNGFKIGEAVRSLKKGGLFG
jgi:uncharacterized protein YoxC